MRKLKLGLAIALLGLVVMFVLQNLQAIEMRFVVWSTEVSLALPLLAAFVIGGLTGRPVLRFLNNQRKAQPTAKPKKTTPDATEAPAVATQSE